MKRSFELSLMLKLRFYVRYVVKKRMEVAIPRGEGSQVPPLVVNRWVEQEQGHGQSSGGQGAAAAFRVLKDVSVGPSGVIASNGSVFVTFQFPDNVFLGNLQLGEVSGYVEAFKWD